MKDLERELSFVAEEKENRLKVVEERQWRNKNESVQE